MFATFLDQKNTGDDRIGLSPSNAAAKEGRTVLKVIDTAAWIAAGIVAAAIAYGASTGYAEANALRPVCAHEEDALDVVKGQLSHSPVWAEKVQQGKCAYVGWPLTYMWEVQRFADDMSVATYILDGSQGKLYGPVHGEVAGIIETTWKPEYGKNPPGVTAWFKQARVPGGCDNGGHAWTRLGICGCCENADRLKTKFIGTPGGEWAYYPDPDCTTKGCALKAIPADVVHEEEIHALNGYDDRLAEFAQMRREGVLFIYRGEPACFWYPRATDN